jgi:TolB-like protein
MPDVFLSYSRDDQATARRFAQGFERAGLTVWWDQTLNAGEAYDEVTEKALEDAKAVVVLWSKKSVASRWVRAEATQADRSGNLVPAMIEDCKRPIMFELKQTADLSKWTGDVNDPDWQAYLASVRRLVDKGTAASPAAAISMARKQDRRISPVMIAVGIAALLVIGVGLWLFARTRGESTIAQAPVAVVSPSAATAAPSLAVLPFVNMSSDPEQEYFSDGLSEELLNQLAKVPELRVIGRTSSFAFKGKNEDLRKIGETLGVNHILEGSVRKAGNRVKITAQLIRTSDGSHLWSETYERTLEDIFAIQEEIARTVSEELQVRMGASGAGGSGTKNVEAYEEYLVGRSLLSSYAQGSMALAVPHLERAVELDPAYVPAWLWLIDSYVRAPGNDSKQHAEVLRRQKKAIDTVLALVPGSPEASFALSYRTARGRDLQGMDRLLTESISLTGGLGVRARMRYAGFLLSVGRTKQSLEVSDGVSRDEPLDTFQRTNMLLAYEIAGDFDRADTEMQRLLQIPGGRTAVQLGTSITRAISQHDRAKLDAALSAMADLNEAAAANVAQTRLLLEDPVEARRELRRRLELLQGQVDTIGVDSVAIWAAWFDDEELALDALQTLSRQGNIFENWGFTLWRPLFRDVRGNPRFKLLVRDVGLVDYWRATGDWGAFCKPAGKDDFECK